MRNLRIFVPALVSSTLAYCPIPGPLLPVPVLNTKGPAISNSTFTFWQNATWLNGTSFSIRASLSGSDLFHFEHIDAAYQSSNVTVYDTQTRIASVTKVFTTLALLLSKGKLDLDDSIKKYVPELRSKVWDSVTLKSLADHTSGLGTNGYVGDLIYQGAETQASLGLPTINDTLPDCDYVPAADVRHCTRKEVLDLFNAPEWQPESPGTGPAYSDIGFDLLGLALEKAYKKPYERVIQDLIIKPLGLKNTGFETPPKEAAIWPLDSDNWWVVNFGNSNPTGGLWSTANDLLKFQQAILSGKLLGAAGTRYWLKPTAFLTSPYQAMGTPWEILRPDTLNTTYKRAVDLYTKAGDVPGYAAYAVLIPEFDIAIAIMVTGNNYEAALLELLQLVVETVVPYADDLARKQAAAKYAGTYTYGTNSSLTISQDNGPGLVITSWTANGVDLPTTFATTAGAEPDNFSIRIYPTDPDTAGKTEKWRISFEMVDNGVSFADQNCQSVFYTDQYRYVGQRVQELVFEIEAGKAKSVVLPAWRMELHKK